MRKSKKSEEVIQKDGEVERFIETLEVILCCQRSVNLIMNRKRKVKDTGVSEV